ncbi:hypothetical protein PVAND_000399 [Polypedilum vanderplanki]|uniref:Nuclear pore protein n=1 Tax=Polypedilum vanderplanki TaxID=319348 RepID=A0A9J6BJV8_POLVA|nr:hypothetical protein PVAND_000399 [Polypedilum vanderplanki]
MDFTTLMQQAQKLVNETQNNDDLPRVERSMPQILKAINELHSRVTSSSSAQDVQAYILLGSKGIDVPKISKNLETLSARKTFETLDPVYDTDIHSFLKNEKENAILSIIQDVNKSSFENAQAQKWDHIQNEWKLEKVKLMNALVGPSQNWIDFRKMPEQTILNEASQGTMKSSLNSIQMAYAREVSEYNRYDKALRPSLVEKFTSVAQSFNDKKIVDMWEIIKFMSNVRPIPKNQDPAKQRFQAEFVDQAKKYLEKHFKVFMQTVISEHLKEAQRGGEASNYKLIEAFVNLKFRNPNELIGLQDRRDNFWPWPMVYYSMRCGDNKSALKCLETFVSDQKELITAFEEILKNPDGKISAKIKSQIKMQYKQHKIRMSDPYKRTVYAILGSCNEQSELTSSFEDYLWMQLYLISNVSTDSSDKLTLPALQRMILEQYGEKYFKADEQPQRYFEVLALTGQFEAAIEFLSRFDRYRTHAVHFALALNELHLIVGPRNIQEPLISVDIEDPKPLRRLNLARLVMLYVEKFEISDPAEALQYYYFLRHLTDPDGKNLFLSCVTDLVVENLNYELVFGKMQPSGIRSRGLIDEFDNTINVSAACNSIADEFVKKGLFEDAIKMYDIADNHEQTIRYIITLLSQVVHQQTKPGSVKERLQQITMEVNERYRSKEISCDPQVLKTFNILRNLMDFFQCYHDNKHEDALEILAQTKLVPLSMNDLDVCVQNFKKTGGEVCKILPDLLLSTMEIIYKKYTMLKKDVNKFNESVSDDKLKFLREQAKAITVMAATVPYRMPGDTNARLIQTEILMH